MTKRNAFTLVELLVVIAILALLMAILLPVLSQARERANRIKCASNLRQIGLALQMYEKDCKQYPRTIWDPNYRHPSCWRSEVWTLHLGVPAAPNDVTAPLFLLFERGYVSLGVFLCPSYVRDKTWETKAFATDAETLRVRAHNFMWATPRASILNYSYANPYPTYPPHGPVTFLDILTDPQREYKGPPHVAPDFALAADANNATHRDIVTTPADPPRRVRRINSLNHGQEGQNVLYMDGHVSWCVTSFCGRAGDNMYLVDPLAPDGDAGATWGEIPRSRNDSVLLPNEPMWDF